MHLHILGICGTFMGSLARLAQAMGHRVTGCDANVYPPMSTQLADAGIEVIEGFGPDQLALAPDIFVIGNVVSRGNPLMEAILNHNARFVSGPEWLRTHLLETRWVLAVAGTHGKTTTASMLAWILESADMAPGFLIGGVPQNFGESARLGASDFFVIEADEYDTAFFDKRSKFLHYRPRTLVLNNLEFDHADIFPDLAAIQKQCHQLMRILPGEGRLIRGAGHAIDEVLAQGFWSEVETLGGHGDWCYRPENAAGSEFAVEHLGQHEGEVRWALTGHHNMANALAAVAAARHVGVPPALACDALSRFKSVKRRMELIGFHHNIWLYDDFAHHPTAIETTLNGLRAQVGDAQIIVVIEPCSNTMKQGVHREVLLASTALADHAFWFQGDKVSWPLADVVSLQENETTDVGRLVTSTVHHDIDMMVEAICKTAKPPCHVIVMSNGGFGGIHQKLLRSLCKSSGSST